MKNRKTEVVTGKVILNYPKLFESYSYDGKSAPRYSVQILIPEEEVETLENIQAAIDAAVEIGKEREGEAFDSPDLKLPLRNGNEEHPFDELYQNTVFFNATAKIQPNVCDENGNEMLGWHDDVQSGDYARVYINFTPYSFDDNKGVTCTLYAAQILSESRWTEIRSNPKEVFGIEKK